MARNLDDTDEADLVGTQRIDSSRRLMGDVELTLTRRSHDAAEPVYDDPPSVDDLVAGACSTGGDDDDGDPDGATLLHGGVVPHGPGETRKTTPWQAFFATYKTMVGVGILALPQAFLLSGLWMGLLLLVIVYVFSSYGVKLLIRTKRTLESRGVVIGTYEELGRKVFGVWGERVVVLTLGSAQLGVCAAYVIFVAETTGIVTKSSLSRAVLALVVAPLFLALAQLRTMRYVSFVSMFGVVATLISVLVVSVVSLTGGINQHTDYNFVHSGLAVAFGVLIFSFEGVGTAISIESSMRNRGRYEYVLEASMLSTLATYVAFATIGYLCFGPDTLSPVTANLKSIPGVQWVVTLVMVILLIQVSMTYPVQLFPVVEMAEAWIPRETSNRELKRTAVRCGLVAFTVLLAVAIPNFGLVLSLVGSLSFSAVGFIFPAIAYIRVHRADMSTQFVYFLYGYAVVGVVTCAASSLQAIYDIVKALT